MSQISYDNTTNTITGLTVDDVIRVTITISKENDNYVLKSQKIEKVDDSGKITFIYDLTTKTGGSINNNQNTSYLYASINGNKDEYYGDKVDDSQMLQNRMSKYYVLPNTNKRKVRQIYNKTLSRNKND